MSKCTLLFLFVTMASFVFQSTDCRAQNDVTSTTNIGELPLINFVKRSDYLDIKISPDTKHLAARIRSDETVYMIIMRVSDKAIVGGVRPGQKNEVSSVTWINNERVLYTFAEKRSGYEVATPTGELFATDIDGKRSVMLAGYRAADAKLGRRIQAKENDRASHELLNILPNDKRNVLVIEYPWTLKGRYLYDLRERTPIVSKLNIYTGKKSARERIPYPGARALANDNGEINFVSWSEDGVSEKNAYRRSIKDPWQEISQLLNDEKMKLIASDIDDTGTKVYLRGSTTERLISTLYEFDLTTQKLRRVFDNDIDLYTWYSDDKGEPYAAVTYPDFAKFHYSNTNASSPLIQHHKKLLKAFSNQDVSIESLPDDAKTLVVSVSSDINPGEYYLYNTTTSKADFLWANYSWIDPQTLAKVQAIQLKAKDGQPLSGYLTMPTAPSDQQEKPLIVLPHGGPHGVRDYPFYNPEVQLLANRGYAVLQVNFRGSGGFGQKFMRAGYTHWGKVMVDDVIDATRWAIKNGYADEDRICIYGASYGGYSALMSSIKAPQLFKCAIGYVGVYDLVAMKTKGDIPLGFIGQNYLDKVLGSDEQDLRAQSPVNHADKIKANVLLIHGDEDRRAPSYHSKKMRSALKKAGHKAEWLYLGDVGHGAFSIKNRTKVYESILTFLDQEIGTTP